MNFLQAIKSGFDRMFDFSTRSSRSEFWYWNLFVLIVTFALVMIFFGGTLPSEMDKDMMSFEMGEGMMPFMHKIMMPFDDIFAEISTFSIVVLGLFIAAIYIAGIAVSVRRLHDLDRSGLWMIAYVVVPFANIFFLIMFCFPGTPEENRFGPNPLAIT